MIPLSVPCLNGNEWKYVKDCLDTGWISSAGSYVNQFETMVADYVGAKYGIACMNGTVGLQMAQIIAGVLDSYYVIAPNITFVATLNSIRYTAATPILIDVCQHTWQMDLELLEQFLNKHSELKLKNGTLNSYHKTDGKRIFAMIPVHVLGNMCDMDHLKRIAEKYHLNIIEDSTEALGSRYNGKHAGTFGDFGVFSFNGNKIISTGGGGVIVTDNPDFAKKARHLSTQAKVSNLDYIHDEIGYNYRLVNILAAVGVAQMEQFPTLLKSKKMMDVFYRTELKGVGDIEFQNIQNDVHPNCWMFTFKTRYMRALLEYLNANGVQSRPFWMPMNQLPMFRDSIYVTTHDQSAKIYEDCISIPSSAGITSKELLIVVNTIKNFYQTL